MEVSCPVCEGPPAYAVAFGTRLQCRCRDCGLDFSLPLSDFEFCGVNPETEDE